MLADSVFSEMFASMSVAGGRRTRTGGNNGVGGGVGGVGSGVGGTGGGGGSSGGSGVGATGGAVGGGNGGLGSGGDIGGRGAAVGMAAELTCRCESDGSTGNGVPAAATAASTLRVWWTAISNDSGLGEEADMTAASPLCPSPHSSAGSSAGGSGGTGSKGQKLPPGAATSTTMAAAAAVAAAGVASAAALVANGGGSQAVQATSRGSRVCALRLGLLGPSAAQACPDRLGVSGLLAELVCRSAGQPLPWAAPTFFESVCHLRLRCPPPPQPQMSQTGSTLAAGGLAAPPTIAAPNGLLYKAAHSLGRGNFGHVFLCWVQRQIPDGSGGLCLAGPLRALKCTQRLTTYRKECQVHRRLQAGHTEDSYRSAFVVWLADYMQLSHGGCDLGCLLLELAPGGSLQDLVGSLAKTGRMLTEREAAFYLAELGCALDFIHGRGFLHLDFKADNVLIAASGHVRLCDLGHALALQDGRAESSLTAGLCTFHLPVEILREPGRCGAKIVTRATDWFSYGCLAFWLLHNYFPILPPSYMRSAAEYADYMAGPGYRRLSRVFARPASLSYRSLVAALLHPEPERRPSSFSQLLQLWPLFTECGLVQQLASPAEMRAVVESNSLLPPFVPLPL